MSYYWSNSHYFRSIDWVRNNLSRPITTSTTN